MEFLTTLTMTQILAGICAVILAVLVLRIRRKRMAAAPVAAKLPAPSSVSETSIQPVAEPSQPPAPAPPEVPAPAAQTPDLPVPAERPDLSALGVYAPHFDFGDSDSFRAAIQEVRDAQSDLAGRGRVVLTPQETAADQLAARAFVTDCDSAIATVRWDTIEQMESRIHRAQAQIDALLGDTGAHVNPEFAALKLDELRLVHEQREKAKQERDLRQNLARIQKQDQQLARDIALAERDVVQLQAQLTRTKAAAQRVTGDQAFELEAKAGDLTRQIEAIHKKTARAQVMSNSHTAGHVFVVSNVGSFGEGVVKIDMTRRADPVDHVADLGRDAVPFPYDIHAMVYSDTAEDLRDALWAAFADHRLNHAQTTDAGFFNLSLDKVAAELARHMPKADFVTEVEAQTYRETLARLHQSEQDG